MRRRKLYRGLAVAFSAILMATSNPATLQNVAAKGIHLQKKAKAKMILEDPTENGVYTLSMTINREGTSEESMLSGFRSINCQTSQKSQYWQNLWEEAETI